MKTRQQIRLNVAPLDVERGLMQLNKLILDGGMKLGEAEGLLVRLLDAGAPVEELDDARARLGRVLASCRVQISALQDAAAGGACAEDELAAIARMTRLLDKALITLTGLDPFRGAIKGCQRTLGIIEPIAAQLGQIEMKCAELRDSLFEVPLQQNGRPDLSKLV